MITHHAADGLRPEQRGVRGAAEGSIEALLADIPQLTAILTYHVLDGTKLAADVVATNAVAHRIDTLLLRRRATTLPGSASTRPMINHQPMRLRPNSLRRRTLVARTC